MAANRIESVPVEPPHHDFRKRRLSFLLGTDEHIELETRVGLVPRHVATLQARLVAFGLDLEVLVHRDAGARAGFSDQDYEAVGATVVNEAELASRPAVDLVHALKEPTMYESRLPGPFLRIGAVHLASKPAGVCAMLGTRNIAAIIDGGTVGSYAHWAYGGDRTPIVGSMSRFAGWVAARKLVEGVTARGVGPGRVVVVGGGIAGKSAIERARPLIDELVVVERWTPAHAPLADHLRDLGIERFSIVETLEDDTLRDAVGVVFAHRSGAKAAEKVCTIEQIRAMASGAGVADIAIDQGGSILHPAYDEDDDAAASRDKTAAAVEPDRYYYAEVNMPREEPRDASEMHGDAILPYLEVLLQLCAIEGGPDGALRAIKRRDVAKPTDATPVAGKSRFDCLVQDLRNGLQIAIRDGDVEIVDHELLTDEPLMAWIRGCLGD